MKMEQTECSEMSAYKIQTPGNYRGKKHTTFRTQRKFESKKIGIYRREVGWEVVGWRNEAEGWNKCRSHVKRAMKTLFPLGE